MIIRDFTMVVIYALSWYHNCKPGRQSLTSAPSNMQRINDAMYTNGLATASSSIHQAHNAYLTLVEADAVLFNSQMNIEENKAHRRLTAMIFCLSSPQRRNDIKQAELDLKLLLCKMRDAHLDNANGAFTELIGVIRIHSEKDITESKRLEAQATNQHMEYIDYVDFQQNTVLHRCRKMRAKLRREKFGMLVGIWIQLVFTR